MGKLTINGHFQQLTVDITRPGKLLNPHSFVAGDAGCQLRAGRICRRRRYPEVEKDGKVQEHKNRGNVGKTIINNGNNTLDQWEFSSIII